MRSPTSGPRLRVTQPPSASLTSHRSGRRTFEDLRHYLIFSDVGCSSHKIALYGSLQCNCGAQSELGDIVYVELPEVGSEVTQGENFGVVESVKVRCLAYSTF